MRETPLKDEEIARLVVQIGALKTSLRETVRIVEIVAAGHRARVIAMRNQGDIEMTTRFQRAAEAAEAVLARAAHALHPRDVESGA